MRKGARVAGLVAGLTALVPLGLAALLAAVASLPHADGTSTPLLIWPLKLVAVALAVGAAALIGLCVAGLVSVAGRLFGR